MIPFLKNLQDYVNTNTAKQVMLVSNFNIQFFVFKLNHIQKSCSKNTEYVNIVLTMTAISINITIYNSLFVIGAIDVISLMLSECKMYLCCGAWEL